MATENKTVTQNLAHDLSEITRCIYGNWVSQVTYVFAELGIADHLKNGPKNIDQLAEDCGVIAKYLKRMLRCVFELGHLTYDEKTQLYHLTPRGELLTSDHPYSKREEARLNGAYYRYIPWGNLLNILKNGMSEEYSPTYKNGSLDFLKDKPDLLNTFHSALSRKSKAEDYKLIKDYDFSSFTRVMDIGSGKGSFVKKILEHNPHLDGCMFDLEATFTEDVEPEFQGRLIQKHGSFFDFIPDWADVYTMKNVIHNWPEDKAIHLLTNVRKAMQSTEGCDVDPSQKRLLIVENLLTDNDEHRIANWMDVNFMVIIDGAERTQEGYRELGAQCGLELESVSETEAGRHIITFKLA